MDLVQGQARFQGRDLFPAELTPLAIDEFALAEKPDLKPAVLPFPGQGGKVFFVEFGPDPADLGTVCRALLDMDEVEPIGLGARDSLRLEGGLCLYGNDIDAGTSPIEGGLIWAIQKVRRAGGERAGGFPGASRIFGDLAEGVARKRVGLAPQGRAPMRAGTQLFAAAEGGDPIGEVTSGGFGPTLGGPVAMGYVGSAQATVGTEVFGEVRGKRLAVMVAKMPLVPANFKR